MSSNNNNNNNTIGGDDDFEDLRISGTRTIHINSNDSYQDPDIQNSINEFNKVSNELESESIKFKKEFEKNDKDKDIELGERIDTEEDFKLIKYFETSQRKAIEFGHRVKRMGVSIKNLTVVGEGADSSVILDNFSPFRLIGSLFNPNNWRSKKSTFNILNDVNGYVEDGKMLLVLGRPGSGCSTLLRVISNQTESYVEVNGEIKYGNIPASEWKRFRGESLYTPEEDIHHPTLTLHETLDFALKLKTPSNRLPDETKRNFRDKIFDLLVSMFGLKNQVNTMVGNEFVRGLSGGERKRTTISEAMVSGASIISWDCSTRGLDSASAYDYAKSLRIMSDTLHKTTIASFYQASDNIYNLFDKVLILDKGRCIYFGPANLAKQYFIDLGFKCEDRKSTPDFVIGVTNPQERIIQVGFEDKVPQTSEDFERAWKQSPLYHQSLSDQQEYEARIEKEQPSKEFREQFLIEKSRTSSKKSEYASSFFTQVIALTLRQYKLVWGNKFDIVSRFSTVFVLSWIFASFFYKMDSNINGLFIRGGALFSSIIFIFILGAGELHLTFMGRRILQKHKSYALYRPSAFYLSQVLIDIPFGVIQVALHTIIIYFMYGLDTRADKFFIYIFTLIGVYVASCSLYRGVGNFAPSLYISQYFMNVIFIFMVNYFGYTIPYGKMHPWFKWFFWVNPLSYAFKALMENEFKGIAFSCEAGAIPMGPNYTDPYYRACPVAGSQPGEYSVSGTDYIKQTFDFDVNDRAFDVCMVYVLFLFYIILNIFAVEYFDFTNGGYTHKAYKKGKAPKMNDIEEEKNINKLTQEAGNKMKENLKIAGGIFTWKNINYTVPVPGGSRLLLDDVMGWIKPGQMTALMGSSGAGKTTLLDVLAKRKTIGTIEGTTLLNGNKLEIDFERITGYVEQMDVHNPSLTVREALRFSAKLRQDPSVSLQEKYEYVEHVLEMMEMKHLGDALVGNLDEGVGISVEERKRLTIGLELVAKPHILFLDEPTSGLDAQSAYNIIKFIRKLTDAGMPLVCTIHQPSSVLFEYFDRILLLAKGGKTVYFGDIGKNSSTLINYFESNGARKAQSHENPAEYILNAIGAGVHGSTDIDWPMVWNNSNENINNQKELDEMNEDSVKNAVKGTSEPREFAASLGYQFWEVYKRMNLIWWRSPFYTIGSWVQMGLAGLIVGFTFFNLGDSSSDMNQRTFYLWESMVLGVLLLYSSLPMFFIQKEYFKRDYASKYYNYHAFSLSIILVEIPYIVVAATVFVICSFWTANLDATLTNSEAGYYWFFFVIFGIYCVTFGQALGAICFNIQITIAMLPLVLFYLFLFAGVQVPEKDITYFWRSWAYKLNPTMYFIEGVLTTVLHKVNVTCSTEDLIKFFAPANETCESYSAPFISQAPGYITTVDAAANECGYCVYKDGNQYTDTLNFHYDHNWRNLGIIIAYIGSNIITVLGFVYLTKKSRR